MEPMQMRLDPHKEAFLIFADSYWDIDNGKSAVELGEQMLVNHVKKARDTAYGYDGYLDETLAHADKVIESIERDNLKSTVDSLCDLGHVDTVTKALKHATLTVIHQNTGVKPQTKENGPKITAGKNRSQVTFNGSMVKRNPTKSFDTAADKSSKISQTMADSDNINPNAKAILREAARKTDGRLVNRTLAASTVTIPVNRRPNQEKNAVTKLTDDEETWTTFVKQEAVEATGRMKSDTAAGKTGQRFVPKGRIRLCRPFRLNN
jgi:hypothetical protein